MFPLFKSQFVAAKPETTASVLESFRSHITRLEGVIETHCNIADLKRMAAAEAHSLALAAEAEAKLAAEAVGKLKSIFG